MATRALILVDIQKGFMPGGPLPTKDGYGVVPVANHLAPKFEVVAATQDWHPANHVSFASNHDGRAAFEKIDAPHGLEQVLWPDHCVQGTEGAGFADGLDLGPVQAIFRKGMDPDIDSYSGFYDNGHRRKTGLGDWLLGFDVTDVYLVGVATDVCVKFTALDARQLGFETYVVEDGTRGVEAQEGDIAKALDDMREAGCHVLSSSDLE